MLYYRFSLEEIYPKVLRDRIYLKPWLAAPVILNLWQFFFQILEGFMFHYITKESSFRELGLFIFTKLELVAIKKNIIFNILPLYPSYP